MRFGMRSLFDGEGGAAGGGDGGAAGGGAASPLAGGAAAGGGAAGGAPAALPDGAIYSDHRFIERLPDDLKADPILGKYSKGGIEGLARSLIASQKMIGKDPNRLLEMPDGAPTPEFIGTVASRLGMPKDVAGYKIEAPKDSPAWMAPTTPFAKAMVAAAHKNNILPSQFQGFFNEMAPLLAGVEQETVAAKEQRAAEGLAAIDKEWGQAKGTKLAAANGAIVKLGGERADAVRTKLIEAGLDTDPDVLNFLANAGALVVEDTGDADSGTGGDGNFSGSRLPPAEAKSRGEELLRQAMNSKDRAERKRLNLEAQKYFSMVPKTPGQKVA